MRVDISYLFCSILRLLAADRHFRIVSCFLDACFALRFYLRLDGHFLRLRLTAMKKQYSDDDSEDTKDNSTDDAAVSVHPCFHLLHMSHPFLRILPDKRRAVFQLPIMRKFPHAALTDVARVWYTIS